VVLQLLAEVLADLGMHTLSESLEPRKKRNPIVAFIGYALFGAIIGGISLIFFSELLLENKAYSIGNIIITPILGGLMMMSIGIIKRRKHKTILRLDSFLYGYIFALMMALTRYMFG